MGYMYAICHQLRTRGTVQMLVKSTDLKILSTLNPLCLAYQVALGNRSAKPGI